MLQGASGPGGWAFSLSCFSMYRLYSVIHSVFTSGLLHAIIPFVIRKSKGLTEGNGGMGMTSQAIILAVMLCYMLMIILIGVLFARRSQQSSENYFLGGRTLGPWVSAMSAEASDMSGYLLMGVPGLAYWCGLADAGWTAVVMILGTYMNWLLVSRRLRS